MREHVDERLPRLGSSVQSIERIERRTRGRLVRERLLVCVDRTGDVVRLALDRFGALQIQRGLLLMRWLERSLALQRLAQRVPAAVLALELGDRRERAGVLWLDAQRLLHRLDRVFELAELIAVTASDLHP